MIQSDPVEASLILFLLSDDYTCYEKLGKALNTSPSLDPAVLYDTL